MDETSGCKLNDQPVLMSPKQFSELTGLNRETVYRLCNRGEIPAVKIGKRWFIDRKEVFGR